MEHIRQYDWCTSEPDVNFLNEDELDNCVTEKIIKNKFYDPLASESDTEPEVKQQIDWDEIFKTNTKSEEHKQRKFHNAFVACLKPFPPYSKLSTLSIQQHNQLLKVICTESPHILPTEYVLRPTKTDRMAFESLRSTYEEEQTQFIEWAKTLWINSHCVRALRPKLGIETVYDAEYKMRAHEFNSYPKRFQFAAQIPFDGKDETCDLIHVKDLLNVNMSELPQIDYPDLSRKFNILRPCSVPEPCTKHPCRFILPNEKSVTMLPLSEIHRELAHFALEHGAQYIVSESALRCFVETDRPWRFPLSVCQVIGPDGENSNIIVMGSDFAIQKEPARVRTYKAYRHLLEFALVPPLEKAKLLTRLGDPPEKGISKYANASIDVLELSSDEEEDNLYIDMEDMEIKSEPLDLEMQEEARSNADEAHNENSDEASNVNIQKDGLDDLGLYSCSCKDSLFEKPPPRSFRKWQLRCKSRNEKYDVIVHCSHKAKSKCDEVILEPIVEYQLDLGASRQSPNKINSLALALALRKHASLMNVRVDGPTGDVVRYDIVTFEEWKKAHGNPMKAISAVIYEVFSQLQGLLPGNYLLQHEPSHGANAILYASRPNAEELVVTLTGSALPPEEEAHSVKAPPTLEPLLLPFHKSRRILPCAFTPFPQQVAKETKKPPVKQKIPPQAIKWPKKKKKKKVKQREQ